MINDYRLLIIAAALQNPSIIEKIDISVFSGMDAQLVKTLKENKIADVHLSLSKEDRVRVFELMSGIYDGPNLEVLVYNAYEQLVKEQSALRLRKVISEASEYLLLNDIDTARNLLSTELASTNFGLTLNEVLTDLKDSLGETSGFLTGISKIDTSGGFHRGNLATILGDSGGMKTMISLYLTLKVLETNPNYTALYFEKEMPVKDIARRIVAYITKTPLSKLSEIAYSRDNEQVQQMSALIDEAYQGEWKQLLDRIRIVPHNKFKHAWHIQAFVNRYKPDLWVLDYFTMLEQTDDRVSSYDYYVQQATVLKQTALQSDSFGIILGQLKQNALSGKSKKIPEFADGEFSSKLRQFSTHMWATFYPKIYYSEGYVSPSYFYLIGLKNRNGDGVTVPFEAYPDYCQFRESNAADIRGWLEVYREK